MTGGGSMLLAQFADESGPDGTDICLSVGVELTKTVAVVHGDADSGPLRGVHRCPSRKTARTPRRSGVTLGRRALPSEAASDHLLQL